MSKNKINKFNKLKIDWDKFNSNPDNKSVRIRDAANKLNVTEAELLSTKINKSVYYLKISDYNNFFNKLLKVDKIMLLIRSNFVVHEKIIDTKSVIFDKNKIIDKENKCPILNFDLKSFQHVFFEKKIHQNKNLLSFQFFDYEGNSIIKTYLKGKDEKLFNKIANEYCVDYNYELQDVSKAKHFKFECEFIKNDNLKLIEKIKRFDQFMLRDILESASKGKFPIQLHALGNYANQYHFGKVKNIMDFGPWINVIDKKFNIHAMEKNISQIFIIKNQFNGNEQYAVEFYDQLDNFVLYAEAIAGYENEFNKVIKKGLSK